mmetsp:Transcript_14242/g.33558  ORF Transcript_14242/g.33558 Transcript_14242/m.33558 type:complete len:351 (+) Transcript_14242:95-1147(+)
MSELCKELASELDRVALHEVEYAEGELFLHILLDEATRLPSKGASPNPYIVISGGRELVQSAVQSSKSPLWNEHLKVELKAIPCVLMCELWDRVVPPSGPVQGMQPADSQIGYFEVVITAEFLRDGGYRHDWHKLEGQAKNGLPEQGKVRLAYSFKAEILAQLRSGLHPGKQRTQQLVNETWVIVGKDYKTHAKTFFQKFFDYLPDDNNPFTTAGHTDLDGPFMTTHAVQVLQTVGQCVVHPDVEKELHNLLVSLGTLHKGMGIEELHFLAMEMALLDTLESALGSRWDDEVRIAWRNSFSRVHDIMLPTFRNGAPPDVASLSGTDTAMSTEKLAVAEHVPVAAPTPAVV